MEASELGVDPRFESVPARKRHETSLDEVVTAWCRDRDAAVEAELLAALGLHAARVEPFKPLYEEASPQFAARGFLVPVAHPQSGTHLLPLAPWTLARTPRAPTHYSRSCSPLDAQPPALHRRDRSETVWSVFKSNFDKTISS